MQRICILLFLGTYASGFAFNTPLNDPYPALESTQNIFYSSFDEQPKTLDPVKSYSVNEYRFIGNIYEPPLQFDYFIRPFRLKPLTLVKMPTIRNDHGKTIYRFQLKPGIYYQPHPGFVKSYYPLPSHYLSQQSVYALSDFKLTGTRELIAADYVYQIKRLANPSLNSPIYELMSQYIEGFKSFSHRLPMLPILPGGKKAWLDLRKYALSGVKIIDRYTFEMTLCQPYQQFLYWLTMSFFAPIPWEVDRFYAQPGMQERNLGFGWYPVGTGPFLLKENNPNKRMVLVKNPNYHAVYYPLGGDPRDPRIGKRLPLIDQAIYTLEKESIPRWNKFLQGYYDLSTITADSFAQAIQVTPQGEAILTPAMKQRGLSLSTTTDLTIAYLGFNMRDPVVGGHSESARLLRQAISIAINTEEYLAIFFNNRGIPAQGPIPPGVLGYRSGLAGINPYVYRWVNQHLRRRPLTEARALLSQAGYPQGIDPKTKRPLVLHYDVVATGGPDDKPQLDWMRKQFAKLGIFLDVRATLFNRFQDKIRQGSTQIFNFGWNADYPDPENFLFLFYGKNGKVLTGGENETNYENSKYDQLFMLMKNEPNPQKRLALIDQQLDILRHDAPWVFGHFGETFILKQAWEAPIHWNSIVTNTLQLTQIDVNARNQYRNRWNRPIIWPIAGFFLLIGFMLLPFILAYRREQRHPAQRILSRRRK